MINFPYTIRSRFIILATTICIIPISIIAFFSYINYNNMLNNKMSDITSNLLSVINWNIDTIMEDIEDTSNVILGFHDIQKSLSTVNHDPIEDYAMDKSIQEFLIGFTNNKVYINSLLLCNENISYTQKRDIDASNMLGSFEAIKKTNWYSAVQTKKGKGSWFKGKDIKSSDGNILLYGKMIKNLNTIDDIGVLVFTVDKQLFNNMFNAINKDQNSQILILNESDVIYYSNSNNDKTLLNDRNISYLSSLPLKGSTIDNLDGKKYMFSFDTNSKTGWKIINIISYEDILAQNHNINLMTVIIAISTFLFALLGVVLVSGNITGQLKLLRKVFKKIEKNESVMDIKFNNRDEVGKVGDELLRLFERNKELNADLYKAVLKEKEAQLIALQAQINPHFLYNTLDSIFWLAEKAKAKDISKMVVNLSKMFKLRLNKGDKLTLVKNEFEQTRCYLEIQNIRYKNKFVTSINVEDEILDKQMLTFLLQPIVENAIYHGLEAKEGSGSINISGKREGNDLVFEVQDDGIGFDYDDMVIKGRGYAMKNIDERIKLYYGENYGIEVFSQEEAGTRVIIRIAMI